MGVTWVLIVAFFSPGGDFMSKQETVYTSSAQCEQARKVIADQPLAQVRTLCVARDRRGVNVDRTLALD